jgi:hypothetical protein
MPNEDSVCWITRFGKTFTLEEPWRTVWCYLSVAEIMNQNYRNYGCNYEIYITIISALNCIYILTYIRILAVSILAVYIFLPK